MSANRKITVEILVNAPVELAWDAFTSPDSIIGWNFASDDWCCPRAVNDLRKGGSFSYRMESKDGSMGFDFSGMYIAVIPKKRIEYSLGDERKAAVEFKKEAGKTRIIETFDAETVNSTDRQKAGWQAILDNYKIYVEKLSASSIANDLQI